MNGEILGLIFDIFCIITSTLILPSLLIWVTTLDAKVLKDKKFIETFG